MAIGSKSFTKTTQAVEESRHVALPIVAAGVFIAVLYFGRMFFVASMGP